MAKGIKVSDRPDFFAATPPLEAVKMVISRAADKSGKNKCLMHNDVSRAYFRAEAVRDVFVEIVEEDAEEGEEVEEHELADGTTVLKGDDGTIYDAESCVPIGKWNEADNSLIKA